MSRLISKIDEAISHISDTHEDLVACMLLEKVKDCAREIEKENAELKYKRVSSEYGLLEKEIEDYHTDNQRLEQENAKLKERNSLSYAIELENEIKRLEKENAELKDKNFMVENFHRVNEENEKLKKENLELRVQMVNRMLRL